MWLARRGIRQGCASLCPPSCGGKRSCATIRIGPHLDDVLRAIAEPDQIHDDPVYEHRRRHYLRGAGPSRWLLVVLSYEQEPARVISAFGNRKDPRSWSK